VALIRATWCHFPEDNHHKRELYKKLQYSNNPITTLYYKNYSKILAAVIRKAKRMEYDKLISTSHNKIKTTWNIINTESGRKKNSNETLALNVNGMKIHRSTSHL
jgi:hypothetical protein